MSLTDLRGRTVIGLLALLVIGGCAGGPAGRGDYAELYHQRCQGPWTADTPSYCDY